MKLILTRSNLPAIVNQIGPNLESANLIERKYGEQGKKEITIKKISQRTDNFIKQKKAAEQMQNLDLSSILRELELLSETTITADRSTTWYVKLSEAIQQTKTLIQGVSSLSFIPNGAVSQDIYAINTATTLFKDLILLKGTLKEEKELREKTLGLVWEAHYEGATAGCVPEELQSLPDTPNFSLKDTLLSWINAKGQVRINGTPIKQKDNATIDPPAVFSKIRDFGVVTSQHDTTPALNYISTPSELEELLDALQFDGGSKKAIKDIAGGELSPYAFFLLTKCQYNYFVSQKQKEYGILSIDKCPLADGTHEVRLSCAKVFQSNQQVVASQHTTYTLPTYSSKEIHKDVLPQKSLTMVEHTTTVNRPEATTTFAKPSRLNRLHCFLAKHRWPILGALIGLTIAVVATCIVCPVLLAVYGASIAIAALIVSAVPASLGLGLGGLVGSVRNPHQHAHYETLTEPQKPIDVKPQSVPYVSPADVAPPAADSVSVMSSLSDVPQKPPASAPIPIPTQKPTDLGPIYKCWADEVNALKQKADAGSAPTGDPAAPSSTSPLAGSSPVIQIHHTA